MFRISDILKKHREEKRKSEAEEKKPRPIEEKLEAKPPETQKPVSQPQVLKEEVKISVSAAEDKEAEKHIGLNVRELYDEVVSCAKKLYTVDVGYGLDFIAEINAPVEKIVDLLSADKKELLWSCLMDYPEIKDYLYYHVANVCIISLEIGQSLGYERAQLIELGIAGFMHDIGIIKYLDIISQPKILSKYEHNKVKEHPTTGLEILNQMSEDFNPAVLDAVHQEHERLDGSGYPQGLKDNRISEYAQIIGLADVYEALLHQRPYRRKYTPLVAIETILDNKNAFASLKLKALIEKIGIFPVGTPVVLNTKEIGTVVKDNPELVMRPVVNIVFDAYGNTLKQPKQINLAKNPMVYIEECLQSLERQPENVP